MLGYMVMRQDAYDALLNAYTQMTEESDGLRRLSQDLMNVANRKDEQLVQASDNIDYLLGKAMLGQEYADRLETGHWHGFDRRDWLRRWQDKRLFCFKCGRQERMKFGVLCEPCVNALEEYSEVAFAEDMAEGRP